MFKSILNWYTRFRASQFLAEGESQGLYEIQHQEDVAVEPAKVEPAKKERPELTEKVLDELDYYDYSFKNPTIYNRQLGLDTFTIYTRGNEVHQNQLASPVVTFLKVIKKGFDEGKINFLSRDMNKCTVRVDFTDKLLFWLKFSNKENLLSFFEGFKLSLVMLEFPSSMNYLTDNERYWISCYVGYRLQLVSKAEEEKRRAATELELQELLK
jgi:hypothetical protein